MIIFLQGPLFVRQFLTSVYTSLELLRDKSERKRVRKGI